MDRSFDLVALLKQQPPTKTHKIRPTQFVSVAGGVQKRLETNIRNRKSCRLSVFDRIRNISKCQSPKAPLLSDVQQKALHRKQQLEKWKEEKEKKKKEAAALKKKPFVAGVSQRKSFGPPPPAKPLPSSSGRVTRSQARQKIEPKPSNTQTQSFAPSNASFKPPKFLNTKVPTLAPVNKKKMDKPKPNITFEPVLPKTLQKVEPRSTRARPVANKPTTVDSKTRKLNDKAHTLHKPPSRKHHMLQSSSSSSDMEQKKTNLKTKPSLPKSMPKMRISPVKQNDLQSSSSSDMEEKNTNQRSKPSQRKYTSKPQQPVTLSQDSSVSQDSGSYSSQDAVSMPSQDESLSTPRNKVPKSESSSEEKLRSPKALELQMTPEQIIEAAKNISPCVTMSRGKDNARKEMKKKLDEGLLDEDNSNIDSVNHFRRQLASEIARMTAMCDTWDQIFAQTVLPEPIQELVLTAVGQSRLLMSQKLQQFAALVEACALPAPGAALVTPADLAGFWDMVFLQIGNIDMRFKKLEELRLANWIEEKQPSAKKVVAKPAAKRAAAKPAGGPSRLRDMIAAARKAKQTRDQSENSESEKSEANSSEVKTFEAGFFSVSSPLKRRSPAPSTPAKPTLLKSVLSNEAGKSASKMTTSFAMLRASLISKNVDIEGVSPLLQTPTIAPVNLYATPARSILKQNNPVSIKKTDKLKTVLFHESDAEVPSSPVSYASCKSPEQSVTRVAPLAEEKENKPTPRRRSRLSRQNAEDQSSPVMTRSRRKSALTPLLAPGGDAGTARSARNSTGKAPGGNADTRRSTRNSTGKEATEAQHADTPKRSMRPRKTAA